MKTIDHLKDYIYGSEQDKFVPQSAREVRHKFVIGFGSILIIIASVPWAIYFVTKENFLLSLIEIFQIFICFLVLWLLKKKKIVYAKFIIIIFSFFFICTVIVVVEGIGFNKLNANHFYFLALLSGVCFLLFDSNPILKYFLILSCIIAFVIVQYQFIFFKPLILIEGQIHTSGRHFVLLIVFLLLAGITRKFVISIIEAEEQLILANNLQEKILDKILPQSIAGRLRMEGKGFLEKHQNCTVLYADIVGFTKLSGKMTPTELVLFLNEIFGKFDDQTTKLGLQKIKTIGDSYMVASCSPQLNSDNHADSILELALKFHEVINEYKDISIRIGINSGSLIEGVIGKKKFTYDLWGKAVVLASAMEKNCFPGSIQITYDTYRLLKNEYRFQKLKTLDEDNQELVAYQIICEKKLAIS